LRTSELGFLDNERSKKKSQSVTVQEIRRIKCGGRQLQKRGGKVKREAGSENNNNGGIHYHRS